MNLFESIFELIESILIDWIYFQAFDFCWKEICRSALASLALKKCWKFNLFLILLVSITISYNFCALVKYTKSGVYCLSNAFLDVSMTSRGQWTTQNVQNDFSKMSFNAKSTKVFSTKFLWYMGIFKEFRVHRLTIEHGVWKSKKKSHSILRAKRATFTYKS